jgi:hypothetical protein
MGQSSSNSSRRLATLAITMCCVTLGFNLGGSAKADPVEAADILIARCDLGDGAACLDIGEKDTRGIGKSIELVRGLSYYEKGCELGNLRACTRAAFGHYTAKGTNVLDLEKAIRFGTKACDGDDRVGCHQLGVVYQNATGMPNYLQRASELFAKSCRLGSLDGCRSAGRDTAGPVGAATTIAAPVNATVTSPTADRDACLANSRTASDYERCGESRPTSSGAQYLRSQSLQNSTENPSDQAVESQSGTVTGRIICTSTSNMGRQFSYTNSFSGTANRLNEYKNAYASIQANLGSSLNGLGFGSNTANDTPTRNCSWHASETEADLFTQRAVSQARREQMTINKTFFSTN